MNTRSTYVGLAIIFLIYSITTVFFVGIINKTKAALQVANFLGPIVVGFFVANLLLANAVELQGYQGGYGTVTKRAGDITIQSEQGSRIHLWKGAIDYATNAIHGWYEGKDSIIFKFKDLESRFKSILSTVIEKPNDQIIEVLINKYFSDHQISVLGTGTSVLNEPKLNL